MASDTSCKIKLGILLSYDYKYIYTSLPLLYPHADEITIAIDKDRRMWSGKPFAFDEQVLDWIRQTDTQNKIRIYEDRFFEEGLSTMQNDTRERNKVAGFMGPGGWHVQIDSDEYFYDFGGFCQWLRRHAHYLENPEQNPVVIAPYWLTLFKKTEEGFVYVKNSYESFPAATNHPVYIQARETGTTWRHVNFFVLHQSWARDPEEIKLKTANWSHSDDFNTANYYSFWESVNESNYHRFKNIHPLDPKIWKELGYDKGTTIESFIQNYTRHQSLKAPRGYFMRVWWREWKKRRRHKKSRN